MEATPVERPGSHSRLVDAPWIHTVLFAIYPVVFLWAQNLRDDPPPRVAMQLMVVMIAIAAAVTLLGYALMRDLGRACLVATAIIGSFSAFGRVAHASGFALGSPQRTLLLVGWIVGTAGLVLVARSMRRGGVLTRLLNATAALLVGLNLVPILASAAGGNDGPTAAVTLDTSVMDPAHAGPIRDVYYLIFDRYAGEDTLQTLYDFDNGAFLDGLEQRGFVVDREAVANYPQTTHSLASSLNMTYLDELARRVGPTSGDWSPLRASLRDTTVSRAFRAMGYTYVHLGSWWAPTWEDPTADVNYIYGGLSEFSDAFWDTTMWPTLERYARVDVAPDDRIVQYHRVAFQVDRIVETANDPAPTFTFAHLTLPHTPYVFHADGSLADAGYRPSEIAYVDQLRYTNTVIDRIVDDLLSKPGPSPIIVLQSDEGPHPPSFDYAGNITWSWPEQSDVELKRKMHILEAFFLPGLDDRSAYARSTPVNTFRLILDDYFGGHLERLDDRSYAFADIEHPYRFLDVTARLR
jgi:hypothetical protein